jgi:cytoskeletal protein CcmA (bactofilin family)
MWKKEGMPDATPATTPEPAPRTERVTAAKVPDERATIGRSITIHGEVTGDEDLLIQGRVDGSVNLKQHSVTIGREGEVKAGIIGRVITVEGSVEGNLTAEEQVILRSSARVQGDIAAPRVVLEDGARFRGGVDMVETGARTGGAARDVTRTPAPGSAPLGAVERTGALTPKASTDEETRAAGERPKGESQAAQVSR